MKHLKLFEEFSGGDLKYDFEFEFGRDNQFYCQVNLKERFAKIALEKEMDWEGYNAKKEIDYLVKGGNDPLLEEIDGELEDCFNNNTIPVRISIDDDEHIDKADDNAFIAKIKVDGQSYNDWIIKNKKRTWPTRTGKKYGL